MPWWVSLLVQVIKWLAENEAVKAAIQELAKNYVESTEETWDDAVYDFIFGKGVRPASLKKK